MSVLENLEVGASPKSARKIRNTTLAWIYEIFPILKERAKQPAGTLSGGEQQMLAIGRALMSNPKVLLIDEMSLGLSPIVVQELSRIIKEINMSKKLTILLVEQDVQLALSLADKGYIIENGRIVGQGNACDLLSSEQVKEAYLGIGRGWETRIKHGNVLQVLLIGVIVGALYGLVALGFGLIMGVMKFINIAQGSFIILGGFICYWIVTLLHIDPYLSIPLVMVAMFIVGLILYRLLVFTAFEISPGRNASG